ncbi:G patch domain-containing protein 3 isoform X2 [Anolis carolinensis]|uniref:G-patch domain containing 3 n=1 Tax=Anolis carolinensis TaxID=28377 RepID=A0A803TLS0_ANOCA|nr:PREDICTED: G patch domain-containing protein 3 isoform X2 [Anolis carolinensis]|eukprot:XP_008118873.1 PREDICTED: G patch domain-containing protein 3 isoform X2 [Anolis carolinensis]
MAGAPSLPLGGRFCLVSGIPARLRSADLRAYFSQFLEAGGFLCFHYRHRPEREGLSSRPGPTCCCLVAVKAGCSRRLVRMFSGKRWLDRRGDAVPGRCLIRRVRVSPQEDVDTFAYKTKKEHLRISKESFTQGDLKHLPELNPPAFMPYGNVGTPLSVFLDLIKACRMPPSIIRKLQLQFPKSGSSRRYGKVPFTYEETETVAEEERVYTATGEEVTEGETPTREGMAEHDGSTEEKDCGDAEKEEAAESPLNSEADDDRCEEWERHEALHEDVTSQERVKERLYEEEIELKWEKGGSGLVFYTDAQYWQQEEEGDFDEQTADDWDVDMSIYYDKDGGDKDARDFVRMRLEQRLRDGLEDGSVVGQTIGDFEKYTKGIGRKVMEKQGWAEGLGLGSSNSGMPEALIGDGQNPKCKRGLGYHGEKLQTFVKPKKPRQGVCPLISTIYDDPHPEDGKEQLLRRQLPISLKYRQDVDFPHDTHSFHQNFGLS